MNREAGGTPTEAISLRAGWPYADLVRRCAASGHSLAGAGSNGKPGAKSRRRWPWVLGITVLLLFVLLAVDSQWMRQPAAIPPEKLVRIEKGDIAQYQVVAVGQVEPLSKVEVKSKANGIIETLWWTSRSFSGEKSRSSPNWTDYMRHPSAAGQGDQGFRGNK